MSEMMAKVWIAVSLCAGLVIAGASAVSAIGNMSGDCLQDRIQLKDGSCDNCTCDGSVDEALDDTAEDCDSCNDYLYDWDFLYSEPGPHQSECGQE